MLIRGQTFELAIGESPSTRYVLERKLDDGRALLSPQTEFEGCTKPRQPTAHPAGKDELVAPYPLPPGREG